MDQRKRPLLHRVSCADTSTAATATTFWSACQKNVRRSLRPRCVRCGAAAIAKDATRTTGLICAAASKNPKPENNAAQCGTTKKKTTHRDPYRRARGAFTACGHLFFISVSFSFSQEKKTATVASKGVPVHGQRPGHARTKVEFVFAQT
ncbi:hypothetical protein psal_cds_275 [Pandoravirus salinus]|uniref:Uncharacterized protein n=1 Tax=Pandoravirus salinus TaxID=1349410 RepID=A0A291ATF0_9VIRU|nr:hypothetical protein psal_cds_275 [Pandoravirus salinus]ATE82150.1 hypothetical protein psal_cds_275 [Pandoravirus salinus]